MAVTGKKINELDSLSTVSNQTVLPAVYVDGSTVNSTAQKISVSQISNKVQSDMSTALANKQDLLTAGNNITISNNIISATDTTYTAGDGISIQNNVISATGSAITVDSELSLSSENPVQNKVITTALNDKQDKLDGTVYTTDNLIAGTNISITQVPAPIIDEYTKALWNFEAGTDDVISGYTHTTIRVAGKDPVVPERSSLYKFGEYSLHNSGYNYCAWEFTSALQSNGEFTLDFWLKSSTSDPWGTWPEIRIFTAPSTGGWGQEVLTIDSDGSVFKVGNSYIDLKSVCPFPEDTDWHHIAITFATSTGNAKFFLDGVNKANISGTQFTINLTNMLAYLVLYDSQRWYFDEIRFSNCIRWTSNFTPFNEPYTQGGSSVFEINNTLDISKQVSSDTIRNMVPLTQAQYDTLAQESAIDANTFYVIVG